MTTTYDLDALLDEATGKGGDTVTLFGQTWTLPVDVDAETMLRVQRLQMKLALAKKQGREVTEDEVIDDGIALDELVQVMAGRDNFAAWQAHEWTGDDGAPRKGLGYRGLAAVAGKLYAIHSGQGNEPAGKGRKRGPGKRT